jgi:hypothetical protein
LVPFFSFVGFGFEAIGRRALASFKNYDAEANLLVIMARPSSSSAPRRPLGNEPASGE